MLIFSRVQLKPSLWDWTYEESLEGQKLPIGHCLYETDGYQLIPEIQYNIERQSFSCDDFNYKILEIHDGSLIDGTGDFSNKGV